MAINTALSGKAAIVKESNSALNALSAGYYQPLTKGAWTQQQEKLKLEIDALRERRQQIVSMLRTLRMAVIKTGELVGDLEGKRGPVTLKTSNLRGQGRYAVRSRRDVLLIH